MDEILSENQETQIAFFRIPKALMTDERYASLSSDGKLLYGLLLDRMSLSRKNGWLDGEGKIYLYYTLEAACEILHCSHTKACGLFAELERAGVITRRKLGQGKPARIYVKPLLTIEYAAEKETKAERMLRAEREARAEKLPKTERPPKTERVPRGEAVQKAEVQTLENSVYSRLHIRLQDVQKLYANKTE